LDGDEGVVLEDILKSVIFGELNGVQLSELDLAPLPLAPEAGEDVLPLLGLVLEQEELALLADLVGHPPRVGWD
jgi:hypothetical protein